MQQQQQQMAADKPQPSLPQEWRRLYAARADGGLVDEEGLRVRAGVIELGRPAQWAPLSRLWQAVQQSLEWPAPGIAVNGVDGYQLWFSLARATPAEEVAAMLRSLVRHYLADVAPARVRVWPEVSQGRVIHAEAVPRAIPGEEPRWSAFVAPDLATVCGEEAALDLPPGDLAQGEVLARLASIGPEAWAAAREGLLALDAPAPEQAGGDARGAASPASTAAPVPDATPAASPRWTDARAFLLAVMNDENVAMALRIEAAKALLAARA